jgi:hypothetical protein
MIRVAPNDGPLPNISTESAKCLAGFDTPNPHSG